ncbi:MAG: LLM class F420-dependent oxidoreductase [Chromatiales bacterium]|nr:LLM class F420-dependent oxidoreductase [Chromatiales bacterium]
MKPGASFPTTEIGNDVAEIRAFAAGVEALGFDYLTCIDHVVQAAEPVADDWRAYYTRDHPFHEVTVLFGYLAALTTRIELATAILILPQRPTALVAKQFAELDVLSAGRIRAGVGIGWNEVEFDALGHDFSTRAARMEEQMELLRALWTQEIVHFDGRFDNISGVGINPLPVQRPIPLWIGAFVPAAIRRAGRLADGLFLNPRVKPGAEAAGLISQFREAADKAGRDANALGLDVTILTEGRGGNAIREEYEQWRELGASHVTLRTMTAGLSRAGDHLEVLEQALAAV